MISRGGVEDTRLEAKAKDTKKIRGQGQGQPFRGQTLSRPRQECSRPRPRTKDTSASALQKNKKRSLQKIFRRSQKKKKVFTKIFQAISTKKRFPKIFQALHKILTIQRGLEASMPRPRTSKCVLEDSTSDD